ncbi:MAG: cyclic nucleotide-binding domain-containing protein [Candidatus Gracilibacteria bacterium]|nr:cyclic nucleotide-binding domain-containing protein [Candidatus Gracilibacteria bacterium]
MSEEALKGNKKTEKELKGKEKRSSEIKGALSDFKNQIGIQKQNPVIAYIEKFDEYFKKNKKHLKKGEVLFSPGIDPNFYIVKSGALLIFSHTSDGDKKEIGKVYEGGFIGEGIIFGRNQKDVEAVSLGFSEVFSLTEEDLKEFEKQNPSEAMEIYKHIIEITNKRLLDSGKELASIYDATNKLTELSKLGEKGFLNVMMYIKNLLSADYIIYVENHPVIDGLFIYKYNTILEKLGTLNKKAGSEITKDLNGIITSKDFYRENPNDNIFALPLKTTDKLKGYFIIGKQNSITDNEVRIGNNLGFLIGSIIESNQEKIEKKAMEMRKNVFDNNTSSL